MSLKQHKTCHLVAAKAANGKPSEAQLEKINQYALSELGADDVYVRTFYIAHNAIDRDGEVFEDKLLRDFVKTLPGKGLFVRHPGSWDGDSGPGEGRWFETRAVSMSFEQAREALREPNLQWPPETEKALLVEATMYMVRTDENATLVKKVDGGVAGDVSVGFSAADRAPIREDGDDTIIAWEWKAPGEALEGSLVWLGAQPGARAFKSATRANIDDEDTAMTLNELQEQLTKALGDKADLASEVKALAAKAERAEALEKALGKDYASPEAIKALLADAEDGRAARKSLIDRLVQAERQAGLVGDSDEEVTEAKSLYENFPMKKLEALAKRHGPVDGDEQQLAGSDPNHTGAREKGSGKGKTPEEANTKDLSTPLANPLFG